MRERFGGCLGREAHGLHFPTSCICPHPSPTPQPPPWHENCRVKTRLLSPLAKAAPATEASPPRPAPASVKASGEAAAAPYLKKES
jgi:hypothetical protein